jgi:toxin ParE1/3/4
VKLVIHPEAAVEFDAAVERYEEAQTGLGDEFEQDVYVALDLIAERPNAWQHWPRTDGLRVFPMERFPYLIPYIVRGDRVLVLAVAHAKRRPGYWRRRAR